MEETLETPGLSKKGLPSNDAASVKAELTASVASPENP